MINGKNDIRSGPGWVNTLDLQYKPYIVYRVYTHLLLQEGVAVMVEDRWEILAMRHWGQAVVQCQRDGGQFVPELVILLPE